MSGNKSVLHRHAAGLVADDGSAVALAISKDTATTGTRAPTSPCLVAGSTSGICEPQATAALFAQGGVRDLDVTA